MIHLLFALSGVLLVGLTLPLILELLMVTAANFLSSRQQFSTETGQSGTDVPKLAIIVPAHNEELLVARCVTSLRASATATTRIFVVAHNCSDTTAVRARAAGAEVLEYND